MNDLLDSSDFDPIQFINENFATEEDLDKLDTFVVGIGSQISALDEEISKAVQSQSTAGEQASKVTPALPHSLSPYYHCLSFTNCVFELFPSLIDLSTFGFRKSQKLRLQF